MKPTKEELTKLMDNVTTVWATPDGDGVIAYLARVSNTKAQPDDPSEKLIGYLLRNHHWSPFQMSAMCLSIHTTRDISAQILRHWSFSFQEFSTRYADVEELERAIECRFQDDKNRQNSFTIADVRNRSDADGPTSINGYDVSETESYFDAVVNEAAVRSMEAYQELRSRGVAKEVARRILPIGLLPTHIYMHGTVRSWINYIAERSKPGVQKEHRVIALAAAQRLWEHFPQTMAATINAGIIDPENIGDKL